MGRINMTTTTDTLDTITEGTIVMIFHIDIDFVMIEYRGQIFIIERDHVEVL